ncbi:MAG: hypothetical protein QW655_06810 [Nitrososphaerota archaeon]
MAVRVRLRIEAARSGRIVETSALVNTGFETERPQLLIPKKLAVELGLWPPPIEAEAVILGTAGGPSRLYLIKDGLRVAILSNGYSTDVKICDALISDIEEEVLINDKLGEDLGIVIERMAAGEWRMMTDPPNKRRMSEKPEYWR